MVVALVETGSGNDRLVAHNRCFHLEPGRYRSRFGTSALRIDCSFRYVRNRKRPPGAGDLFPIVTRALRTKQPVGVRFPQTLYVH
jgi:hypothetical protein